MLSSASARPTWLDCQRSAVLLPHFRSVLAAKDLKFRFHTSDLPWLPKTWCFASALLICLDCQRPDVSLPHFRSVFTAKDLKFRVRTFSLPWRPKMWSSASALPLCLDCQICEVPFLSSVLRWLPKIWSSASALPLCLDWQTSEVPLSSLRSASTSKDLKSRFRSCSARTSKDMKFRFRILSLPGLPKICSFASTLSLNLDCPGTTDDVATIPFQLSSFLCLPLPSGNLQTPFLDVIFRSLLLTSSPSCTFHYSLQNCLCHARGSWDVVIPSEFPFLQP